MKVRAIAAAALTAALAACSAASPTTATVQVGDALTFSVEVADTEQTQRDGLSGRTSLSEGTGMLFPFEERQEQLIQEAKAKFLADFKGTGTTKSFGNERQIWLRSDLLRLPPM